MLEHLRSRDAAFLIHMTDDNHGAVILLRPSDQLGCAFADLTDAAGRPRRRGRIHRLHRVHDHYLRGYPIVLREHRFHIGLAQDKRVRSPRAEAVGAHLKLTAGFLARHIHDRYTEVGAKLHEER